MIIRISAQRKKGLLRWFAALSLMLLYGAGSTQTGYLHQLFHPDEVAEIHTPKQESDPCHRSLFHGVADACDHEFHVVKVSSCGLVHIIGQSHLLFSFGHPGDGPFPIATCTSFSDQGEYQSTPHTLCLRGPPATIRPEILS